LATDPALAGDVRCPRCGAAFHCGALDAEPCACTRVHLSAAVLAALRAQHAGCLCLNCLRELAGASAPWHAANPRDNGQTGRE